MKKLFSALIILAIVYAAGMTTGNQTFAASLVVGVSLFSALMYSSKQFQGMAFSAIVIPDFTAKADADLETMTAKEILAYRKLEKEFETATLRKEFSDKIEELKKDDSGDYKAEIETLKKASVLAQKQLVDFGLMVKAITEPNSGMTEANKSDLVKFIERDRTDFMAGKSGMETVTLKAAALMTTANVTPNVAGGFNQLFGNSIDSTIYSAPKDTPFIMDLVDTQASPGTENLWYVERVNEEGDAEFILEGALKPLIDGEYLEKKADVKEVAERWKMSNRLMNHAPSVASDFRAHADELISLKMDAGVLSGDGVGANLNGITTLASPFVVPTALANFYEAVNIWDVINAVSTYIRLNNHKGNLTCVLNTVWKAKMAAYKDANDNYIIPPFVSPSGDQVGEVKVMFENGIVDTHILLGDLKKFKARISEDIKYYEGWENDDFSKNLSSRKLEAFLGTYLPASDSGAIIYDAIATISTAIEVI